MLHIRLRGGATFKRKIARVVFMSKNSRIENVPKKEKLQFIISRLFFTQFYSRCHFLFSFDFPCKPSDADVKIPKIKNKKIKQKKLFVFEVSVVLLVVGVVVTLQCSIISRLSVSVVVCVCVSIHALCMYSHIDHYYLPMRQLNITRCSVLSSRIRMTCLILSHDRSVNVSFCAIMVIEFCLFTFFIMCFFI